MSKTFEDLANAVAMAEIALQDVICRIEEARNALVTAGTPVHPEVIDRWLQYIAGTRELEPCVLCGDRQLEDCGWACVTGGEADGL